MKARVKWAEAMRFVGGAGSGHGVIMDASATPEGETTLGPSPMEMMLLGMGGCASYDVVAILKKMRQPVEDVVCELEAERADEPPRVFTKIHAHFTVTGEVAQAKAEEAVALSLEKYCSATIMLAKTAEVTREVTVVSAS